MQVTVTRRGGIAGVALRGSADADAFDGAEAALRASVGASSSAPPLPDAFQYEVTFEGQTVTLGESELSGPLRALIDAALANSEIV